MKALLVGTFKLLAVAIGAWTILPLACLMALGGDDRLERWIDKQIDIGE